MEAKALGRGWGDGVGARVVGVLGRGRRGAEVVGRLVRVWVGLVWLGVRRVWRVVVW